MKLCLLVLVVSILMVGLSSFACGKKKVHSIKDCNQQTVGLVDCRYMGWQSIPYDVFDFPVGKNAIKLSGNPFHCDCGMAWFYKEPNFRSRNKKVLQDVFKITCETPRIHRHVLLSDVPEYLLCGKYRRYYSRHTCDEKPSRSLLNCDYTKRTLPFDIFETKMKKISMKNFEYNCDCGIVWFLRKLKKKKNRKKLYKPSNIGKCVSPKRLASRKVQHLTEEDVCPQLPRKAFDACRPMGPAFPDPCLDSRGTRCKNDKYSFKCVDIDECTERTDGCTSTMTCINETPGFKCDCKIGYKFGLIQQGMEDCIDINECEDKSRCGKDATCTNVPGSYKCKCNEGFKGEGKVCYDINECLLKDTCSKDAKCVNSKGSFTCTCNSGFSGNGEECKDINECSDKTKCADNADCSNFPGFYKCKCKQGYTGNGKSCTDIDECSTKQHTCYKDATCINTAPGYQCHCKPGYNTVKGYDIGRLCEDVNECQSGTYCSRQATCENNPGSFQCNCKSGYTGNGKYCDDINECADSNQCSVNAKCENTAGSYKCTCNTGFYGNGKICKDQDECLKKKDFCLSANSKCFNTPGSYKCNCNDGYSWNSTHCTDIDECQSEESPHACDENKMCINFPGRYKCQCKEGYERFTENGPCFKEEVDPPFYEHTYVRIAALGVAVVLVLLTMICCCKCCCRRKSSNKEKPKLDESEEPLLYGADVPYIPFEMSPIPPNASMASAYSENQDFDYCDIK